MHGRLSSYQHFELVWMLSSWMLSSLLNCIHAHYDVNVTFFINLTVNLFKLHCANELDLYNATECHLYETKVENIFAVK